MIPLLKENTVEINNNKIKVEIADTPEKRTQGLMHRQSLKGGMLFIFEEEKTRSFWMKNTLIPLDIIFINKNLKIIDIQQAIPCKDNCISYISKQPAQYVLEVNHNYTIENNIKVSDNVKL